MARRLYPGYSWLFLSSALGLILVFGPPVLLAQSTIFNGPRNYPVGYSVETGMSDFVSWTVADFNGDGLLDIAVANNGPNNVSVLLQNPDGTYQPAVNYTVGNAPVFINTGDFNGDGNIDLVVVNSADNTLGVLLGNGDGTFQAQVVTALPVSGTSPTAFPYLVVGDWNGDGKTDVALAGQLPQAGQYAIGVMLSNGGGTFQTPVTYSLVAAPFALNAGDFNGDGKLDLVTADTTSGLSVWLGNGDGTFQSAIVTKPPQPFWQTSLVIGDFNQDGHLDIATATMGIQSDEGVPDLTLFLGNGSGGFQSNVLSSLQYIPYAAGDLNGDGKADLMVSTGSGTFVSLLNTGNATFTVGPSLILDVPDAVPVPVGAIALADLNGNGKLDLVTGFDSPESSGLVSVIYGNGDGSFAQFPVYSSNAAVSSSPDYSTLVAADFNNDGKPDLATAFLGPEGYLNVSVLLNDGAGFSAPISTVTGSLAAPTSMVAGNFKLNGSVDVAIAPGSQYSGGVLVLLGNGNGTFQTAVEYGQQMTGPLVVGDFNGDGKPDILGLGLYSNPTTTSVLLGNGDGTFGFPVISTLSASPLYPVGLTVADFNGDGKLDIAALVSDGNISQPDVLQMFFGNGDGTFSVGPTYNAGTNPASIATGDLNGDGIPDLVVLNNCCAQGPYTPSAVVVLLGNGDGTFQSPITTVTQDGLYLSSVFVTDFNLDGKADVIFFDGFGISLLLGNGDGTLQTPLQYFLGPHPYALAIADFDGNGAPDLAANGGPPGISLLLNASGSKAPSALVSPATLEFGSEPMGQSASLNATLTNMATTAQTISGITISGPQSGDFAQTNSCGTSLAAGLSCTITVTFNPLAAGARTATIQISDSATNSPQIISLVGTATVPASIGLGVSSGSSNSATVTAGQTASYTLSIGGAGMSGSATITCTGAPKGATCSVPGMVTVSGTAASTVKVSVTTTSRTTASANYRRLIPFGGIWAAVVIGILLVPASWAVDPKRRYLAALTVAMLLICSCGSNSPNGSTGSTGSTSNPNGTPAGSYTLTVTATLNSVTQTATLGLKVQ